MSEPSPASPGAFRSTLHGAVGFAAVSVAAFSVWAFAGKKFPNEGTMYAAVAAVFVALSGIVLHPLVAGPRRLLRFTAAFVPAFLAYAAAWCAAWFPLRDRTGEWLGSAGGSVAFALVAGAMLRNLRAVPRVALLLFACHSAGYFAGGEVHAWATPHSATAAMLGWGLAYGFGFGAGIGIAFARLQQPGRKA